MRSASAAASSKSCVTRSVGRPQIGKQLRELAADDAAGVGVERGERLVEQEHGRVTGECAGERDPLTLATRQLARSRGGQVGDPEALEQLVDPLPPAEADVAAHVEMREERVLLEDEPDRATLGRKVDPGARCRATSRAAS